jgi:hypothetical protein
MQNIQNNKEKVIEHNTRVDPCAPYTRPGSGPPNFEPPSGCVCPAATQWKINPTHPRRGIYGCFSTVVPTR